MMILFINYFIGLVRMIKNIMSSNIIEKDGVFIDLKTRINNYHLLNGSK